MINSSMAILLASLARLRECRCTMSSTLTPSSPACMTRLSSRASSSDTVRTEAVSTATSTSSSISPGRSRWARVPASTLRRNLCSSCAVVLNDLTSPRGLFSSADDVLSVSRSRCAWHDAAMSPTTASAAVSGADSAPAGTDVDARRHEASGPGALSVDDRDEWPAVETASEWRLLDGLDDSPVTPADAGSRCKCMFGRRLLSRSLPEIVDGGDERNEGKEL